MNNKLVGKVVLITGGSRGIGRGMAHVLIEHGATVYITGRCHQGPHDFHDVMQTASELNELKAGKCIGVFCDHNNDEDTKKVFDLIKTDEKHLDVLINNAISLTDLKGKIITQKFWEEDPTAMWDKNINVGLRSYYIASCEAIKLMLPRAEGLIINISSFGGMVSMFNPLYGVAKEGIDRLSYEMGCALKNNGITVVSLWPGVVRTEIIMNMVEKKEIPEFEKILEYSESVYFTGRAVNSLISDKSVIQKTGRVLLVADLATEYGFTDIDGKVPPSFFGLKFLVSQYYPSISHYIPSFLKIPKSLGSWYFGKF